MISGGTNCPSKIVKTAEQAPFLLGFSFAALTRMNRGEALPSRCGNSKGQGEAVPPGKGGTAALGFLRLDGETGLATVPRGKPQNFKNRGTDQ